MRKLGLLAALVVVVVLVGVGDLTACHNRCGGCYSGCGYGCGYGGCYSSCCYSSCCYSSCCYSSCCYSGCSYGYCGYGHGGHAAAYGYAPTYAAVTNKATVVVTLPADAKLTIDGTPTTVTSARRVFQSPALTVGQDYVYTLKAEVVRDGKPVEVAKTVTVRANQETAVDLQFPAATVAAK
jgi:uncharacterized protein (TIGR03000 family)